MERTDAISSISVSGTTIELGFSELEITPTSLLALSYSGASIESVKGGKLSKVIKLPIANKMYVVGGQTIFADCEHSDSTLLGGRWYSYSDGGKGSSQSYKMLPEGANSTETGVQFTYEKIQLYAGVLMVKILWIVPALREFHSIIKATHVIWSRKLSQRKTRTTRIKRIE